MAPSWDIFSLSEDLLLRVLSSLDYYTVKHAHGAYAKCSMGFFPGFRLSVSMRRRASQGARRSKKWQSFVRVGKGSSLIIALTCLDL
jgi:hypothetical protein